MISGFSVTVLVLKFIMDLGVFVIAIAGVFAFFYFTVYCQSNVKHYFAMLMFVNLLGCFSVVLSAIFLSHQNNTKICHFEAAFVNFVQYGQTLWCLCCVVEYFLHQLICLEENKKRCIITHCIVWSMCILTSIPIYTHSCALEFAICVSTSPGIRWGISIIPRIIMCLLIGIVAVITFIHKASLYTNTLHFLQYWKIEDLEIKEVAKQMILFSGYFIIMASCLIQPPLTLMIQKILPETISFFKVLSTASSDSLCCAVTFFYFHYLFNLWGNWKELFKKIGIIETTKEESEQYVHLL
ncbi:hypothetical protein EDI_049510 [Entamoeba dispar SAW760]|uniref:G-protein coupled receptors family 1 profile domain-containing protein n=1 Tax=Entamoeba dispar (strain ATCC PRA-260 / SAW760) TaxID=370354 RepID=B0EFG1_ENTDS|nr:uncharacterized protein EDI_049510 [Entamoeba dispar SAW760]EDR26740.1 hypothetical protein EDI_049510 [Entamoeba dispar SAW760]|eukprot:EDR26740.1 hypothetical protein EDI_049510 [Entamoeba dispar SAW760]